MVDPKSERAADVSVERAAVLIRTLRYSGADECAATETLGVKSMALYELLMAHARRELVNRTQFMLPFSAAKAFLQVTRTARIREYINDLSNTSVSYEFKDVDGVEPGRWRVRLLDCSEGVDEASGERCIRYSLPEVCRQVILAARGYTWLELAPFAKFSSKYAARLYPILALRAGMSFEQPYPISVTPEELANQLGWNPEPGKFKFANFEARCLLPALADISLHVRRFRVIGYDCEAANTRGRPVIKIHLTVSRATKPLSERRKAKVLEHEVRLMTALMTRQGIDVERELPTIGMLARAATVLDVNVLETAKRWTDALNRAREFPSSSVGQSHLVDGSELIAALERRGVEYAFQLWMRDPEKPSSLYDGYDLRNLPSLDPDYVEVELDTGNSTPDVLDDFIAEVCGSI
jgi:hypothetical protein